MSSPKADARIQYGSREFQFGDLRLPGGSPPFPVVIGIHGGYYRSMYGLDYFGPLCESLREVGTATWNIEYRRVGNEGGGWPGTFLDIAHAVDHLREIAPKYNLDLTRVVPLGHSAGGHFALWVAGRSRIAKDSPLHVPAPLSIKAAVSLAGVLDSQRAWELKLSGNITEQLMGGTPTNLQERYAAASPYALLPLGVPQILFHGCADDAVPVEMSTRYFDVAKALGDPVTLVIPEHTGHFEFVDPRTKQWAAIQQTILELI